jgi:putative serine protease PepD
MSPKHLWTGEWRAESDAEAAARRERERREAQEAATQEVPRPRRPATEPPPERPKGSGSRSLVLTGLMIAVLAAGAGAATVLLTRDDDPNRNVARPAALPASTSTTPLAPKAGQTRAGAIYAKASPAVVSIRTSSGSGTGFLVDDDGTIVTNDHVVENSTRVQVRFGTDGRTIQAEVKGVDPSSDLAVIKIAPSDAPSDAKPLEFADSDGVAVGDDVIAIGNPFGLDRTATEGIVSSLGRTITAPNNYQIDDIIQTDAAINPGNSGGPLLDARGMVIGVNSQIATSAGGSGNVGIGFAVPSNTVRQIVPGLAQGKSVSHAWLGVSTSATSTQTTTAGAQLADVTAGGPADKAGLQAGDVVTSIDGQRIDDPTDLSTIINKKAPGDRITLDVQRSGDAQSIEVELEDRPATPGTP